MHPIPVEFVTEEDLGQLLQRCSSVVHLKGFGSGMDVAASPPPRELVALLAGADMIVFDGDDWDPTSFVAALRVVVDERFLLPVDAAAPLPHLVAFKYAST
eukprot:TRINITY_DN4675_c0_g1_i1.p2 TRINITY_DN4675_c0_g1~~TRINITY_DN4675_c0_g1_i1.p2  ORF type:complete len:111 (+),score=26.35 TRINITY_DN4675_c0_g1_i1:33-335(+)